MKLPTKTAAFLFLLAMAMPLIFGCVRQTKGEDVVYAPVGGEFELKFGQNAIINGPGVKITFLKVIEDSRCPIDVTCFWQGEARVLFNVSHGANSQEMVLATQSATSSGKIFGDHFLKIISLDPAPVAGNGIGNSEYTATLVFSKLTSRDIFDFTIEKSCHLDSDCMLVNSNLDLKCCWEGSCDEIDYSKPNWIAVNSKWFSSSRAQTCPLAEKCGPAPLCPIKIVNSNFDALCIENICKKVQRSKYEYYTFDWSDGACNTKADCSGVQYGCGFDKIVCTNDSIKWKNTSSTCDAVLNHPLKDGYRCSCVLSQKKCAWVK